MKLLEVCTILTYLPWLIIADNYDVLYFEPASLECNFANHNISDTEVKNQYWILPDGRIVDDTFVDTRISIDSNYTLKVTKVDDIDFGRYHCLLVFSNYSIFTIEHGINVDGPYFGDLLSKYTKNAIIGGVAAGSLFLVLAGGCLLWNFRFHKRIQRNKAVDALDKAIDGYDLSGYDNVGQDTADTAVTVMNNQDAKM